MCAKYSQTHSTSLRFIASKPSSNICAFAAVYKVWDQTREQLATSEPVQKGHGQDTQSAHSKARRAIFNIDSKNFQIVYFLLLLSDSSFVFWCFILHFIGLFAGLGLGLDLQKLHSRCLF